jgi:hypothetical protein
MQSLGKILDQRREKSRSHLDGRSLKNRAQRFILVKLGEVGKVLSLLRTRHSDQLGFLWQAAHWPPCSRCLRLSELPRDLMHDQFPGLEISMINIVRKGKGRIRFRCRILGNDIFLNQQIDKGLGDLALIQQHL